jgi:hypothetical protein
VGVKFHQVRVTAGTHPHESQVFIDGEEVKGVTRVDISVNATAPTVVALELFADVEFEGQAEIVLRWRDAYLRFEAER